MVITDEDIEYAVLFALMGDCDFNEAIHALFDTKGIDDPVARDKIAWEQNVSDRMIRLWCRAWLQYGYGWDPNEFSGRIRASSTEK